MAIKNFTIQNKLTNQDQLSVKVYLQELNSNKHCLPIPLVDELEMFKELKKTGDKKLQERLFLANTRWVITIAKQYENEKAKLGDLINEGNIGMIKAMSKFDPSLGYKFITFATDYIRREINTYVNQTLADVVQPVNRKRISKLLKEAEMTLKKQGNDDPSVDDIVELYTQIKEKNDPVIDVNYVVEMYNYSKGFVSASTTLSNDNDNTLEGTFVSNSEYNADNAIVEEERKNEIHKVLSSILNEKEKNVIVLHFGIDTNESLTLEQVAEKMNYTRERIGQILQGALKKLSNHKQLMFSILGSSKGKTQVNEHSETNPSRTRVLESTNF